MATRRKKPASAEIESQPVDGLSPSASATPTPVPAPKKKRAVRKAKTEPPAEEAPSRPSVAVEIPVRPHVDLPSPTKVDMPSTPNLPYRPSAIPMVADQMVGDVWRPSLSNSKKISKPEVEDILASSERAEPVEAESPEFFRPPVRAGIFRKVGIGFALIALAVLIFVGYVAYAHATVMIYPKTVAVKTSRVVVVSPSPSSTEVSGKVLEATVSGEKTAAPGFAIMQSASSVPASPPSAAASATAAVPRNEATLTYGGTVTLYNETSLPVTLVPTTRLLTASGALFRLKEHVNIPARGSVKAIVAADQPGQTGAVGPSSFTIPGLPADKQKVIYAQSDAMMTAKGQAAPSPVMVGASSSAPSAVVVQADDIDAVEKSLRGELIAQAQDQLKKSETGDWSGKAYLVETMSRFVSAAPGQSVGTITVRLTLRVREVIFDREKAIAEAKNDLQRGLTSDRELISVKSDTPDVVEQADPASNTASVQMTIAGASSISMHSPLFDAEKLRGLDIAAVQAYFDGIEGVDRVEVTFRPFWIKRMPDLKDHIDFQVVGQN